MEFATLDDLELSGKRVLVRADLNVPIDEGRVTDTTRIAACAATLQEILEQGGRPIVMSHLGRPKGARDSAFSLKPVVAPLGEALGGHEVVFVDDCIGETARRAVNALQPGQIALLENLRFHSGEKDNDPAFSAALAELGDLYVNDAFSASHRAHASVVGLAERLPAAAGRLMEQEISALERWLAQPRKPYIAILGGAKVESKFPVVEGLLKAGAVIFLAGGMANTALLAQGHEVGKSAVDKDLCKQALTLLGNSENATADIILPVDVVVAPDIDRPEEARAVAVAEVPPDSMILDLGPRSLAAIRERLADAATVVWNGPLGVAEEEAFADGTLSLGRAVAEGTGGGGLISVVGGGDTLAALRRAGLLSDFTYACMAGGAFLTWLAGDPLPGVEALQGAAGETRQRRAAR